MNNTNTFLEVLADYQTRHNFGMSLGIMSKHLIISRLSNHLDNKELKEYLKPCLNLFQIIQVIQEKTQELVKVRTPEQIEEFKIQLNKLIKLAGL